MTYFARQTVMPQSTECCLVKKISRKLVGSLFFSTIQLQKIFPHSPHRGENSHSADCVFFLYISYHKGTEAVFETPPLCLSKYLNTKTSKFICSEFHSRCKMLHNTVLYLWFKADVIVCERHSWSVFSYRHVKLRVSRGEHCRFIWMFFRFSSRCQELSIFVFLCHSASSRLLIDFNGTLLSFPLASLPDSVSPRDHKGNKARLNKTVDKTSNMKQFFCVVAKHCFYLLERFFEQFLVWSCN